jgi:hypothetical protein
LILVMSSSNSLEATSVLTYEAYVVAALCIP